MRKPSDKLKINPQEQNDLEFELCRLAYIYVSDYDLAETVAFKLAEAAIGLKLLENLKNELENAYGGI